MYAVVYPSGTCWVQLYRFVGGSLKCDIYFTALEQDPERKPHFPTGQKESFESNMGVAR